MFIAALFTRTKLWKQTIQISLSLSLTHTHTHTMEYYSAIKKNGILPFNIAWMNLVSILLSEINQNEYHTISLVCGN